MKSLYIGIIFLSFFQVKAQQNVILQALEAPDPDPAFTITKCYAAPIGYLGQGLPATTLDIAAKQQIDVNVEVPGPYNFSTPVVNGVKFSKSGVFTTSGVQTITLDGSGAPTDYTVNAATIAYNVTNGTAVNAGNCNFTRKVYVPDQNYTGTIRNDGKHRFLYKVIIGPGGKEWLQTNLGAHYNQVGHPAFNPEMAATDVDDYLAFGSLFQIGRNSDGHELINWTSATSGTGLSTTSSPAPDPTTTPINTGLFYTSTNGNFVNGVYGNYYGRTTLEPLQLMYIVGPGKPCPSGFTIALENSSSTTSTNQYGIASNAGSTYWINSPLKLVAPKLYRNGATGGLVVYNKRLIRTTELGIFPIVTSAAPQYVIEGGIQTISTASHYQDRRVTASYVTGSSAYDPRGSLDGYPVRCMKP